MKEQGGVSGATQNFNPSARKQSLLLARDKRTCEESLKRTLGACGRTLLIQQVCGMRPLQVAPNAIKFVVSDVQVQPSCLSVQGAVADVSLTIPTYSLPGAMSGWEESVQLATAP